MRYTNMSQPKISATLLVPTRENRRRSTVSFLAEDTTTDCHTVTRAAVKVENTFQLEPIDKLSGQLVRNVLQEVMKDKLDNVTHYDSERCKLLATNISDTIKSRLKDHLVHRYRLVCLVHIAELTNQSLIMASRCLWNPEHDNFWSAKYANQHVCAVATVYAVYLE